MQAIVQTIVRYRLRAILSLLLIVLSTLMNWYWLWGLLILLWAVNDMLTGQVWLSETIEKRSDPLLYHLVLFVWLVFGFYFVLFPFVHLLR